MPPVARPAMRSWRKSAILYPLRRHPGSRRRRLSGTITYTGSSWVPALAPLGRDDSSGRRPLLRSLAELRQFAGDLLLTGDDLGDVADAIDVAFVVPGGLQQDARLILRRDRQAVHGLGKRLAVELAELPGDERGR